jgi:acetyl-CoA carboxylase alpha subunit
MINKKEKTYTPIDVAIPADTNVVQKEAEKKLQCKSLVIEIQRMWNLKCTVIPVIIGATGMVKKSVRRNL